VTTVMAQPSMDLLKGEFAVLVCVHGIEELIDHSLVWHPQARGCYRAPKLPLLKLSCAVSVHQAQLSDDALGVHMQGVTQQVPQELGIGDLARPVSVELIEEPINHVLAHVALCTCSEDCLCKFLPVNGP
jgi:hypothetical protein